MGSDRRPETKQGIEGKIVRFRSGRVRDMVGVRVRIADLNQIADLKLSTYMAFMLHYACNLVVWLPLGPLKPCSPFTPGGPRTPGGPAPPARPVSPL